MNCWEFKKCGRQPGGELNGSRPCQVPKMSIYDGINGGKNGGRVCWIVADTVCDGDVQETFHQKLEACSQCDFYRIVKEEEGGSPKIPLDILEKLCSR